jgi:hypothetical protein
VKHRVKELTDADVSHISMVDRGAIREPWRIIKHEGVGTMFDLAKIFKTATAPAAIVAVAFAKNVDPVAAAAVLDDAGLTHGDAITSDVAQTFLIDGADPEKTEGATVLKINDDVGVVMTGLPENVRKGYVGYDFESTDFKTVYATNKAPSLIACAMSALQDTIYNCLSNADTTEVAKGDIESALNDFSNVVLGVVEMVPQTAFKLEAAVVKAGSLKKTEAKEPAPTGQITEEEQRKTNAEPTEAEKAGEQGKVDPPKEDEGKEKTEKKDEKPEALDPEIVAKADAGDVQAIAKLTAHAARLTAQFAGSSDGDDAGQGGGEVGAAGEGLEVKKGEEKPTAAAPAAAPADLAAAITAAVQKALEPVTTQITDLTKTVGTVQTGLKKMDDALHLDIIEGGDEDDDEGVTVVKTDLEEGEAANDDGFLVIDTAYEDPFPDRRRAGQTR